MEGRVAAFGSPHFQLELGYVLARACHDMVSGFDLVVVASLHYVFAGDGKFYLLLVEYCGVHADMEACNV
jgi:hypothetical protein